MANLKSIRKIFIYWFLISYLFLISGVKTFAVCSEPINTSHGIECPCCHSKIKMTSNHSISINSECPCTAQKSNSTGIIIQASPNPNYTLEELNKITDISSQIYNIIVFKDISYHKIRPNPNIALNNILESLRTVILLN